MTEKQQQQAAAKFAEEWAGKGYEKGESQPFWMALLHNVYGVDHAEKYISFENQVKLSNTSFIDGYIEETHVLIEQKGLDKDLRKPIKQSDGTMLTPFEQAKRYAAELPYSKRPRWVVVCNFQSFLVYDMEQPNGEPEEILLKDLGTEYYRLQFLVDTKAQHLKKEMEVSIQAGNIVGSLYNEILQQYINPESPESLKSLNILCVRLVFCLYAEDAGIFGRHGMFHDYLAMFPADKMRTALIDLFKVLNTPVAERDPYMDEALSAFPYVNGGLFERTDIEIPRFNENIRDLLLQKASDDFDWSMISPTIFGAVFESTLNPETRRKGGMHYTSIENIHKLIDPLFLDSQTQELEEILTEKVERTKRKKLETFQTNLASLTFLDPACGSGNFLTETYISLRRLENKVIRELYKGQAMLGAFINPVKVGIHQFYGIEINDFAVTVAKTALWIAESQMLAETEAIVQMDLDFLPLKSYTNIVEGNALRMDWESVVPKDKLSYIMGNPPFVGARLMSEAQKEDVINIFGAKWKNVGNLDYVSCWYKKATDLMRQNKEILTALVSTNSVSQGEQVANLWGGLMGDGLQIHFAHRTFRWDSEASIKAHVHCVIIGFGYNKPIKQVIFEGEKEILADNINAYLLNAPNAFIESRKKSISDTLELMFGNMANDGGHLNDYKKEEKEEIIAQYPQTEVLFKRFLGAEEFINGKERWCLWLKDANPSLIKIGPIHNAVLAVKELREKSTRPSTRKLANTPTLFGEIRQTEENYLLIPRHSSEKRRYIPIGYFDKNYICGDANFMIPDASIYHFGILTSNVHMAWVRAVCGRLEMRYRYSKDIVYNNFPWPTPTESQKAKIEQTAQAILDARALYPKSSLADLYDEVTMPPELRKAHQANDKAVMQAYGFPIKDFTESDCVAELFKLYNNLTKS